MNKSPVAYECLDIRELEKVLETSASRGLSCAEAATRLKADGPNAFAERRKRSVIDRIVDELRAPLTFTLLAAGVLTTFLEQYINATVIFFALIVNVAISLYQEGRASKAFALLAESEEAFTTVVRDGEPLRIPSREVVRGDVILLDSGASIPADARIIDAEDVETNESPLSGEWEPITKAAMPSMRLCGHGLHTNMLFSGTLMASGIARAIVVETGERTAFGRVATEVRDARRVFTPMQELVARIARMLSFVILAALLVVLLFCLVRGVAFPDALLVAIAIAVAAIPEGLPAAVSVMLAMGMQRLLRRGGLVRNLLAAETLGGATVIVTDKTGTLTEGKMSVEHIVTVSSFRAEDETVHHSHETHGDERDALAFAFLACDVVALREGDVVQRPEFHGRPAEVAIARAALISGVESVTLHRDYTTIDSLPFRADLRLSATLSSVRGMKHNRLFILGAAEETLAHANAYYEGGRAHPMDDETHKRLEQALLRETKSGARAIAVGFVDTSHAHIAANALAFRDLFGTEGTFVFCALFLLSDSIRPGVSGAIATARAAGVRVIMATGDNPETARNVALRTGITKDEKARVVLGEEFRELDDRAAVDMLREALLFARMLPSDKSRLAKLLEEEGEVVAMTGDGVNDVPALRNAAIGVALGSGTDVAKETSGLVLTHDDFSVIVAAIEEGRRIADNVSKSLAYLLSMTFPETALILAALCFAMPLPLLPIQIIWSNMLTEGFMSFTFAFEPAEDDVMRRRPRAQHARELLSGRFVALVIANAIVSSGLLLWLYLALVRGGATLDETRTVLFAGLTAIAVCLALPLKNLRVPFWKTRPWANVSMLFSIGFAIFGAAAVLFVPQLVVLFGFAPNALGHYWIHIVLAVILMLAATEVVKYVIYRKFR